MTAGPRIIVLMPDAVLADAMTSALRRWTDPAFDVLAVPSPEDALRQEGFREARLGRATHYVAVLTGDGPSRAR